uniref:Uncharacterized protein n=1 Tax=viral metagenome TaxID=1070528 RepID=A0A6C0BZ61_9ZZZZ
MKDLNSFLSRGFLRPFLHAERAFLFAQQHLLFAHLFARQGSSGHLAKPRPLADALCLHGQLFRPFLFIVL